MTLTATAPAPVSPPSRPLLPALERLRDEMRRDGWTAQAVRLSAEEHARLVDDYGIEV